MKKGSFREKIEINQINYINESINTLSVGLELFKIHVQRTRSVNDLPIVITGSSFVMKREREENDEFDDDNEPMAPTKASKTQQPTICPYIGTVNRERLDFDFEKICSVSLVSNNVYACLGMISWFRLDICLIF